MPKTRFNFGLTTIEKRRERGDMIQYYKINKSIDQVHWINHPKVNKSTNSRFGGKDFISSQIE